jgi:multiple sugar transport system permease protein
VKQSTSGERTIIYALLVLGSAAFLLPFVWMISSSLKSSDQIFSTRLRLWPSPAVWKNYTDAVSFIPFGRYLTNTLLVCMGGMIGNLFSASLVAYSFVILRWRGRENLFKLLLATMLLPPQVTMIPVFVIFRKLNMIDTFWPLILPAFLGTPFFIFLVRQFYLGIPGELIEAARIDGCREWSVYWRVVVPLSGPVLATVALFSFIWAWTDFLTPLIYLQDQSRFTLSLGLQQFLESHGGQWGMLMAASTIITLPIVALFFILQRTFVQGIAATGFK